MSNERITQHYVKTKIEEDEGARKIVAFTPQQLVDNLDRAQTGPVYKAKNLPCYHHVCACVRNGETCFEAPLKAFKKVNLGTCNVKSTSQIALEKQ